LRLKRLKNPGSVSEHRSASYQGIASAMPKTLRNNMPLQGLGIEYQQRAKLRPRPTARAVCIVDVTYAVRALERHSWLGSRPDFAVVSKQIFSYPKGDEEGNEQGERDHHED
jgi:hypothetical protein